MNNIKEIRLSRRLTRQELGDLVDRDVGTIKAYESGKVSPRADAIFRLARALGVTVEQLMDWNSLVPETESGRQKTIDNPLGWTCSHCKTRNTIRQSDLKKYAKERAKGMDNKFMYEYCVRCAHRTELEMGEHVTYYIKGVHLC